MRAEKMQSEQRPAREVSTPKRRALSPSVKSAFQPARVPETALESLKTPQRTPLGWAAPERCFL